MSGVAPDLAIDVRPQFRDRIAAIPGLGYLPLNPLSLTLLFVIVIAMSLWATHHEHAASTTMSIGRGSVAGVGHVLADSQGRTLYVTTSDVADSGVTSCYA